MEGCAPLRALRTETRILAWSMSTATSGTLVFAAEETGKTVSVPILDDATVGACIECFGGRFTGTPKGGFELADGGARDDRIA